MALVVISPAQGLATGDRALNIVVLAEGFLASRVGVFLTEVRRFDRELRTTAPFHRFAELITVSALFVPSNASIANITNATRCAWRAPNLAGQIPPDDFPSPFDTAFGALFCRLRDTTPARAPMPRALAGDSAKVESAIKAEPLLAGLSVAPLVLVDNTQADGGQATGRIGWFSMQSDWVKVAIHELGHSAFGLADEYDNDGPARHAAFEPFQPNVTTRATRDDLRTFFNATPDKFSLIRWHELMDPATPAPTSVANPACAPLATIRGQSARPGVADRAVGLFEGADHSPCGVFRPRLDCRMRHTAAEFCPVCEWTILSKLARTENRMRVDTRLTIPGAWTVLGFYHEPSSPQNFGGDLSRVVFYAAVTGEYQIHDVGSVNSLKSAPGVLIDSFWTSLSTCEIAGVPHLLAHSLPLGRIGLYEVTLDGGGKQHLDLRFDSGNGAVPWSHVTTFVSRGQPHMIGYESGTGRIEISRIDANNAAPKPVSSTALDPTNLWLPGYTIITTFTVDSVPHVLKLR